ncbi:MAG: type II toxin-antitoxin system VapC family toxin [Geminicoccaceae bacterium]|nr:type II toxin-antitoxin system VapC family toxin [Geminicoccaceae bacterium]
MSGCVLDTNLVCEPLRPRPSERVAAWFAAQDPARLFLTATVVGEIAFGIRLLPAGRRRGRLEAWLDRLVGELFADRILAYDREAALLYGALVAEARRAGRMVGTGDAQIAAVAKRHGLAVATRDVEDFETLGVAVVNPWAG